MSTSLTTDILILGAGIGGFETFRTLDRLLRQHGLHKTITIVDENNYFTFTPLLHEVASGSVEPSHAAVPLRELVYRTGHRFLKATVQSISPQKKTVTTSRGTITYDYCVLALGSSVNFFNTPGADKHAYTVRTLPKAMQFREQIIKHLEQEPKVFNLTVVGGGFTGVEVAGQLAYFMKHTLRKMYPTTTLSLRVIEATSTVVPMLPLKAQNKIIKQLKKLHVELFFEKRVAEVTADSIKLASGETLTSDMTVWCTGIGNLADCFVDKDMCTKGRLPVTNFLNHANYTNFYGVGDITLASNPGSEVFYPQLGEAAHKEGEYVARHIVATLKNKKIKPFLFKSLGTLMPIGERYAVAIMGNFVFSGLFAWWLRRTVYLLFMPGWLRKLKIVIDWTLHLFSFGYIIVMERK